MHRTSPFPSQSMNDAGNVETTLLEASTQMARAQLQRHISNSSSIVRRRAPRVTKPASTGTSPQPYQRRRATTQTIPRHRASLYQQCLDPTPETTESGRHLSTPRASMPRPVSWHPNTMANSQRRPQSDYEAPLPASYNDYNTYSVNGIPTPMSQAEFTMGTVSLQWQHADNVSSLYQQSSDYDIKPEDSGRDSYFDQSYPSYSSPAGQISEGHPIFSPVPYPLSAWTSSMSTVSQQTAPPTPECFPTQPVSQTWQDQTDQLSPLSSKESKELIGMGLYDGPDRHSWSLESMLDGPTNLFAPGRPESMGKGLKLEEKWEPPEEEEDETDSEGQDGEEDEEAEATAESETQGTEHASADSAADEEIIRLAEGALGLGNVTTYQSTEQQRTSNASNQSFFSSTNSTNQAYANGFGIRNMWQGQIADYCVG